MPDCDGPDFLFGRALARKLSHGTPSRNTLFMTVHFSEFMRMPTYNTKMCINRNKIMFKRLNKV
jgi:hypothetical protein